MKAFLLSVALLIAVSAVAAIGLHFVAGSSTDTYTERASVRLDKRS